MFPKRRHIKFRRGGITQKKAYNMDIPVCTQSLNFEDVWGSKSKTPRVIFLGTKVFDIDRWGLFALYQIRVT